MKFPNEIKKLEHRRSGDCFGRQVILPTSHPFLEFSHHERVMKLKFIIYADIESILEPIPRPENHHIIKSFPIQKHIACSFAYKIVCSEEIDDARLNPIRLHRGAECMFKLIEGLRDDCKYIANTYLNHIVPLKMSDEEKARFKAQLNCHLCGFTFGSDGS